MPYVYDGATQRRLRSEQQLSPEHVGAAVGRSSSLICRYERGASIPPFGVAVAIAHILGVPVETLAHHVGSPDTGVS